MNKQELEQLKQEIQKIKTNKTLTKDEKILQAVNLMPWIRNSNVRHAYNEVLSVVYGELM